MGVAFSGAKDAQLLQLFVEKSDGSGQCGIGKLSARARCLQEVAERNVLS